MGVFADPAVDMAGMTEWKDGVVTRLTRGVESLCESAGVNLVEGTAEFVDDGTVRVAHGGDGQGSESLSFEHAIVATGSRPMAVPGFEFDGEHILSSKDALALESVPEKLLVVGAGYIGMELSTVFAKLGAEVTVVEMLGDVLPGYEDDVAAVVRDRAEDLGIDFNFGEAADDWDETEEAFASRPSTKTTRSPSITPRNVLSRSGANRSRTRSRWRTSTSRRTRTASSRPTTSAGRRTSRCSQSATWPASRCLPTRRWPKARSLREPPPANPPRSTIRRFPPQCSPTPKSPPSG